MHHYAGLDYQGRCYEIALGLAADQAMLEGGSPPKGWPSWLVFWVAWRSARMTACALLDEARKVGVIAEQWEALRKVAAEVAAD